MSANIINKSGSTSTFIPGGTGQAGKRAPVTFYGTSESAIKENPISFILNDSSVQISNIYGDSITPDINDCIIYAEPNQTYLLYITGKQSDYYEVEISETWKTQSSQSDDQETDISNISLNVTCLNNINQLYHGFRSSVAEFILDSSSTLGLEAAEFRGETNPSKLDIESVCGFTFAITSLNSIPLGEYKLQIEFTTDWISPGMDTKIAKKFQPPSIYSGISTYDDSSQGRTLRGYITNYSCKGSTESYSKICPHCGNESHIVWIDGWWAIDCENCGTSPLPKNPENVSENFDDEKLDNFEVTIKDFTEGVGEISYRTTTYIPIDVLKNAYNAGYPYKCILYLYVNGINGSKEKILMRDLSSTFNTAIMESDSSIYIPDTTDIIIDDPNKDEIITPQKPPVIKKYAGTAHYGQDTNIINIGNKSDDTLRPSEFEVEDPSLKEYLIANEYTDDVYVNNITVQSNAGTGNWCHCTYNAENHTLKYEAVENNNTGSVRYAYFVHTTTDNTLSYGPNAGKPAMTQWTVTVSQKRYITTSI